MTKPPQFDPAEFARTLDRVAQGKDASSETMRPKFDPQVRKDVADEAIRGRKIEDFHRALEQNGWVYVPSHLLPPYKNGMPQPVGLWKHPIVGALTEEDITSMFPGGPEEFDFWTKDIAFKKRMQALGLVPPRGQS